MEKTCFCRVSNLYCWMQLFTWRASLRLRLRNSFNRIMGTLIRLPFPSRFTSSSLSGTWGCSRGKKGISITLQFGGWNCNRYRNDSDSPQLYMGVMCVSCYQFSFVKAGSLACQCSRLVLREPLSNLSDFKEWISPWNTEEVGRYEVGIPTLFGNTVS